MRIKGITAKQAIVSPTCRANHGKAVAAEIAVNYLLSEYGELVDLPTNKGTTFHFYLSVERKKQRGI